MESTILGAAGEHYVMYQLLRRNHIAALAPTGVPDADVIMTDRIGDRLCAIQVKSRRDIGSDGGWHMRQKHEGIDKPDIFYCFVDFGKSIHTQPKCWIIPSAVVARVLKLSHQKWLSAPGKDGKEHKDGKMRRSLPSYEKLGLGPEYGKEWLLNYRDRWDLLVAKAKG